MNRKQFLLSVAGAGLGAAETPSGGEEAEPKPLLAVSIAPSEILRSGVSEDRSLLRRITLKQPSPHLNIALRNLSDQPLHLWSEGCSWGCYNLSLEVAAIEEKVLEKPLKVERGGVQFGANAPTITVLPPGEMIVREAELNLPREGQGVPQGWAYWGFPFPPEGRSRKIQMRAVYEVHPDAYTRKHRVWTGRIVSPTLDFDILREGSDQTQNSRIAQDADQTRLIRTLQETVGKEEAAFVFRLYSVEATSNYHYRLDVCDTAGKGVLQSEHIRNGSPLEDQQDALAIIDVDGDGYRDIKILGGVCQGRKWYKVWLYDAQQRRFTWSNKHS
jgi:hypothetical protein